MEEYAKYIVEVKIIGHTTMSHTMKLWERVVEARLIEQIIIFVQQYGLIPRKSTIDAMFGLRMLMEE